ncbi:38.7k protein [Psilogramma increta granulovirus]|uniref:38.7k protein n=1 Tax=Psilogramma increta granulovirus TaxID=2953508 RepID=A0A977TNY3_9BBAC|nr:38.7k protein [Psilogramma increta granulovirus]
MNSWLNNVFNYLFGQRFEEIKRSLDLLTQRVNYLYTNVYHKTFKYNDKYETDDEDTINTNKDIEDEEKEENSWLDKTFNDTVKHQLCTTTEQQQQQHVNSLNFGVFVKSRLNNHTQLQYVSGTTENYNTIKSLYTDMTQVVELLNYGEECEVNAIKLKINTCIEMGGFKITHISDNSKIVNGHVNDVIDEIKQIV